MRRAKGKIEIFNLIHKLGSAIALPGSLAAAAMKCNNNVIFPCLQSSSVISRTRKGRKCNQMSLN